MARHNRAAEARRENIIKLDLTENEILTCNANIIRNGPTTFHQQDGTMNVCGDAGPRSCCLSLLHHGSVYLWCLGPFLCVSAVCDRMLDLFFCFVFFCSSSCSLLLRFWAEIRSVIFLFLFFVFGPLLVFCHTSHKFTCSSLCTICVYVAVLFSSKILRFIQYTSSPQHIQFSFVFHLQQQTKK